MNRLEKLKKEVADLYNGKNENRDGWADWMYENHVLLVADSAEKLAGRYGADRDLSVAAALLHDIADAVMKRADSRHEEESNKIAEKLLKEAGFGGKEIEVVIDDALKFHGCCDRKCPKSIEGRVMAAADGIAHMQSGFYDFAVARKIRTETRKEVFEWAIKKIDRDFNNKISFEDLRAEIKPIYDRLCEKLSDLNQEIILRRAGVEDIGSILEAEKSVVGTKIYSGLTGKKDTVKEMTENIFYVIEKEGRVIGDIAYQMKDKNHAYISGLAVAKEFQGQGFAKQALRDILEKLKDVELIDLMTHPENGKAIGLYKSLGFKQIGEPTENYFGDGELRIRMVLQK